MNTFYAGSLWKLLSCLCFAAINGLIKGIDLPAVQIACLQDLGAAFLLAPFCMKYQMASFSRNTIVYWLRPLVGIASTLVWIHAIQHIPLFQVVAMGLFTPFVTLCGAWIFLGEKMRWSTVITLMIATIGGLCISTGARLWKGDFQINDSFLLMPIIAKVLFSACDIMSKKLIKDSPPIALSFSLMSITGGFLLLFIPFWKEITLHHITLLTGLSVATALAHYAFHKALSYSHISTLIPMGSVRFIATALIGWMAFGERPTVWFWGGCALIGIAIFFLQRYNVGALAKKSRD